MNTRDKLMDWTAIDRAHERADEADEAFDERLAAETKVQAAAIRKNVILDHQQTLAGLAEVWAERVSRDGVTEQLIRVALAVGPLAAGQVLRDMIDKCIEASAENAALVELDRAERSGGLNFAAMRAAAPELRVPA